MIKQLNIINYKAYFILGNNECEKLVKRPVLINISIRFADKDNIACSSDILADTICYSSMIKFLDKKLENANINLVEHAAQFIYEAISEFAKDKKIQKRVEVIKDAPHKENLHGVSFICTDW